MKLKNIVLLLILFLLIGVLASCNAASDAPVSETPSPSPSVVPTATPMIKPTSTPTPTPIPTPTPTPSPTPVSVANSSEALLTSDELTSLESFLNRYVWYGRTYRSYDWRNASESGGEFDPPDDAKNILEGILWQVQCCDFDIYPGEAVNKDNSQDWIYNGEKTEWILKNIFNCNDNQIIELRQKLNSQKYYYDGDYHFTFALGFGGGPRAEVAKVMSWDSYYFVTYDITFHGVPDSHYSGTVYALMEQKEIGGKTYWSLYYSGTEPFSGQLPSGAIVEEGTLPVSTRTPEPVPTPTPEPTPAPTPVLSYSISSAEAGQIAQAYSASNIYPRAASGLCISYRWAWCR